MLKIKSAIVIGLMIVSVLLVSGCFDDDDNGSSGGTSSNIKDAIIEGKYEGKNNKNDSVIILTEVIKAPKAEEIYAGVKDDHGNFIKWTAPSDFEKELIPISSITTITPGSTTDSDIRWLDIYEDHKIAATEKFFISERILPEDTTGYTFILEYKDGTNLLAVFLI